MIYHNLAIAIYDVSHLIGRPSQILRVTPPPEGVFGAEGLVMGLAAAAAAVWISRLLRRRKALNADTVFEGVLAAVCMLMLVGVGVVLIRVPTEAFSIMVLAALILAGLNSSGPDVTGTGSAA